MKRMQAERLRQEFLKRPEKERKQVEKEELRAKGIQERNAIKRKKFEALKNPMAGEISMRDVRVK